MNFPYKVHMENTVHILHFYNNKKYNYQWSTEKYTFATERGSTDTYLLLDMGMQHVDLPFFLETDYCMEDQDHL